MTTTSEVAALEALYALEPAPDLTPTLHRPVAQGDLLFIPVGVVHRPLVLGPAQPGDSGVVVVDGKHQHIATGPGLTYRAVPAGSPGNVSGLLVVPAGVTGTVTHTDHHQSVVLDAGEWVVVRQREAVTQPANHRRGLGAGREPLGRRAVSRFLDWATD